MSVQEVDKALSSVCKGEDKKSDAMMLMSPDNNWDRFLTPAPCAIALLGDLILISADTDFSLEEKPPRDGFKLLRYPNSFRASLVQVSNAGWSAFNQAHTNMDQIRLHSGNVDGHVKNAVRFLIQGTPVEVEKMLPMSLTKVQNIADESLRLATEIEDKFIGVMELTAELLEACTNTKGVYDEKTRETEIAIEVAKTQKERKAKEVAESQQRLEKMEKEVKEAQEDFKEAIKSVPSGMDLLCISAGEALIEGVRNFTSIPSAVKRKFAKAFLDDNGEVDDSQEEADTNKEMSRYRVYTEVPTINRHVSMIATIVSGQVNEDNQPCPDWGKINNGALDFVKKSIETSKNNISKETNSGKLREEVLKICDEAIYICTAFISLAKSMATEDREGKIMDAVTRSESLQQTVQALDVKASKFLGKNPLDNKSPHLSKMPTQSASESAVKAATENARYKTELAKETLKDAKRRQEQTYDELRKSNEELTQVLMEMAKLDLKKIDFDTIRETLVKGIKALAKVREQWGQLVRFFQMLSNLIKCCLHTSLTDFVDQAKQGREIQMADQSVPLSNIFRDVIFEQALKASQVAYVVQSISGTYVQISNDHLMDRITCLGRLVALDPKKDEHEISLRRNELHNGCEEAQRAITNIIRKQKEEFNEKVNRRIAQISELEKKLPPIEPKREKEIKAAVETGMKMSEEEMDDLV